MRKRKVVSRRSVRTKRRRLKRDQVGVTKKNKRIQQIKEQSVPTVDVEAIKRIFYEDGHHIGKYEGGELILANLYAEDCILPDVSVEQVIELGFAQVKHLVKPLLPASIVYEEMKQALEQQIPFSVVRLGDGELLSLAHDTVRSAELILHSIPIGQAGMDLPEHEFREQLAESVRKANIVGMATLRHSNYQALVQPVFNAYGLQACQMKLTSSYINYYLGSQGYLLQLMQGRRVIIVGNKAPELASVLEQQYGIVVTAVISPVHRVRDVPRVLEQVAQLQNDYELALIPSGIPAVILAQRIADDFGKVALDFGFMADVIIEGKFILNKTG